jgi:cytosine/uracil/thiamine/allantoin permease
MTLTLTLTLGILLMITNLISLVNAAKSDNIVKLGMIQVVQILSSTTPLVNQHFIVGTCAVMSS